ncbi:MAG: restriction endonuclease [Thermoproteota archaeon]
MKFCPHCGAKLGVEGAKFCPECGSKLSYEDSSMKLEEDQVEEESQEVKLNVYDLGVRLEETAAKIFEKMGYKVELRKRLATRSGATAEIDILITRGNRRRAVECKNYDVTRAVGVSELRIFKDKLNDTGLSSGIFITNSVFTEDAEKLAESAGIELWDGEELREKFFLYAIGRLKNPSLLNDPILPKAQSFVDVSTLPIKNPNAVNLYSAVLFYHPYVKVKYRLFAQRKDSTGKLHKISDEGTCIVDALDGDIINKEKGVMEKLGVFFQEHEKRLESKKDTIVAEDLISIKPVREPVYQSSDYQVSIAEPEVTEEEAVKISKNYAIAKNTTTVKYEIKNRGSIETRTLKIVPKQNEINIRGVKLIYVPIWDLEYESGEKNFVRRFIASSGRPIEDSFLKCEKCTLIKRQPIAVCEVCGALVCEKHAINEGQRWVCENHSSVQLPKKSLFGLFGKGK